MQARHSPGPWSYTKYDEIVDGHGKGIVCTFRGGDSEKTRANIDLIKAAPQLLEALYSCICVMQIELEGLKVIQPELKAAREAMTAALGEPVQTMW